MATVSPPELEAEAPIVWMGDPETLVPTPAGLDEPDKYYEIVDGLIVEELPLGAREVWIASRIIREIILFDPPGHLGTIVEEMLFVLDETPRLRRRPDLAFVTKERWAVRRPVPREAAWDVIPDLAVEIISPTDLINDLMAKLEEYFAAGVRLVWVVYPDVKKIYTYDSPTSVRILQVSDDLDGGAVLPGFQLPLATLFETAEDEPAPAA